MIDKKSWRQEGDSSEGEERETPPVYKWESCPGSRLSRLVQIAYENLEIRKETLSPFAYLCIFVFIKIFTESTVKKHPGLPR